MEREGDMRVCKKCNQTKYLDDFKKNTKLKSGYDGTCKSCRVLQNNKSRKKIIESEKEIITIKTCRKCKINKEISEFTINTSKKDGYTIYCKACTRKKSKAVRDSPKNTPDYKVCNECQEIKDKSCFNKTCSSKDNLSYTCKDCTSIKNKEKYKEDRDIYLKNQSNRRKQLKQNDPEKLREKEKEQKKKYKDYYRDYSKTRSKNKRLEDPVFKLIGNLRTRIKIAFLKTKHNKTSNTREILGCSWEEFKNHIERQFESWMTWENYGNCEESSYSCSWHLDHIIPVSYSKTEEEVCLLNHWSNFQPLCSYKNMIKNKYMGEVSNIELKIQFINSEINFSAKKNKKQ